MAALREEHLRGWGEAGELDSGSLEAAEDYLAVLAIDPAHPRALGAMEDLYRRCGDWRGLLRLLERRRATSDDPARRLELSMALADIAQRRLGDTDAAVRAYEAAMSIDPRYLPAIRSLKRIYQNAGNWEKLTELLEAEGQVAADGAQAVAALYQAGTLREGFGHAERAIEDYQRVLKLDPQNGPAFNRMEALLRSDGQWRQLIAAHMRRLEVAPGAQARAQTWLSIGRVYEHELESSDKAVQAYLKALKERPDHVGIMHALGDAYFARGQWDEAMSAYNRIIELSTGRAQVRAQDLVPIHLRLGEIFQSHRPDPGRGRQHLEAVLALEPNERRALAGLGDVYRQGGEWRKAADVLGRLVDLAVSGQIEATGEERVGWHMALAEAREQGHDDAAGAADQYSRALALQPDNEETVKVALDALCRLYERLRDWPRLLDAYGLLVGRLDEEDPRRAIPLRLERARLYEQKLGERDKAIVEYRHALDAAPDDLQARISLAELYARRTDTYDQAVDELRRALQRAPLRAATYQSLYEIFKATQRYDRAWCVADALVQLGAASEAVEDFWKQLRERQPKEPSSNLTAADNAQLVVHPAERGFVHDLFRAVGEDLCKAWPDELDRWGLGRGDRLGARSDALARKLVDSVGLALGGAASAYDVYVTEREPHALELTRAYNNAAVIVGSSVRVGDRHEVRAKLAPLMQRVVSGQTVPSALETAELTQLVYAAVRLFDEDFVPAASAAGLLRSDDLEEFGRRFSKAMSRRGRRAAEEVVLAHLERDEEIDVTGWVERSRWSCDRATLAATGDLSLALKQAATRHHAAGRVPWGDPAGLERMLGELPGVRELMCYAVSEEYFTARERLGLAVV